MTWMLTGVTLVALLSLGSLFVAPQSLIAEDRPRDLVQQFYARANDVLAGGSPTALERVVAPEMIDHRPGMPSGDRATLVRRLTDLHRAAPDARLHASAILEDGEWAVARVTPLGLRPKVHGIPLDPAPEPPAQIDVFRVVDNMVVEYWPGGTVLELPQTLPTIFVAPSATDTTVSLAQITFPSGAGLFNLDSPGEHLILLERGELGIRLSGSASFFDAARPDMGWQVTSASEQDLALRAGDAVLIPPGTRHSITNVHADSATILGVAMFPAQALEPTEHRSPADLPPLMAIYDPRRLNTWVTWDRHVVSTVLAVGITAARTGPCAAVGQNQLRMTRFVLAPGNGIPVHDVEGLELLVIVPSGFDVGTANWDTGATPATVPTNEDENAHAKVQRSGHAFAYSQTSAPPVRNSGRLPLDLVSVALQSTGGRSCAVSPVDT